MMPLSEMVTVLAAAGGTIVYIKSLLDEQDRRFDTLERRIMTDEHTSNLNTVQTNARFEKIETNLVISVENLQASSGEIKSAIVDLRHAVNRIDTRLHEILTCKVKND